MSEDLLQRFLRKTWIIASALTGFGFIGFVLFLIRKVRNGEGLHYYIGGMGFELSYLGVLMFIALIPVVVIGIFSVAWYQEREERDFKKKYLKEDNETNKK
jgi:hypothetical protein